MATAVHSPNSADATRHWEWQYLDLMRRIWEHGDERVDRTGVGTRSLFGAELRFDLADGRMPLLTTKRVFWKTATRELLWFLTGDTNIRPLCAQGVEIWTDWPLDRYRRETGEQIARAEFSSADRRGCRLRGAVGRSRPGLWQAMGRLADLRAGRRRHCSGTGPGINQVAGLVESLQDQPR